MEKNYVFFERILAKNNLKTTPQRLQILSLVQQFEHIDIDKLYEEIAKQYPHISLATVYKNISTMVENGILSEIKITQGKTKYELATKAHAHFICINCKKIEDVNLDIDCILKAFNKNQITDINVEVYGLCSACEAKSNLKSSI